MGRHVVLLRGINLAGRNRLAMADLREALTSAGFDEVRTFLQSGNVVLSSSMRPDAVARVCEQTITDRFGLQIPVVTRTRPELAEVLELDPLGDVATDPRLYQVSFLSSPLPQAAIEQLSARATADEQLVAIGREIYTWHPAGAGRSKLAAALSGRGLGVTATARNWSTTTRLLALADG